MVSGAIEWFNTISNVEVMGARLRHYSHLHVSAVYPAALATELESTGFQDVKVLSQYQGEPTLCRAPLNQTAPDKSFYLECRKPV